MSEDAVRRAFPELTAIEDDDLRAGVVDAWATAMAENDVGDLGAIPWLPPAQRDLGLDDEYLVEHVRDVTGCAVEHLLGHPHDGVHVVARADLPVELAHIVLSHTGRTTVEPATLEAEIVRRADEVAAATIRSRATRDLRSV